MKKRVLYSKNGKRRRGKKPKGGNQLRKAWKSERDWQIRGFYKPDQR